MAMDLHNKTVTVIGAGRSGLAAARLIVRNGGRVKISEKSPRMELPEEFRLWAEQAGVAMEWGGNTRELVTSSDLVVLSPGVPIASQPVAWAKASGIPVIGEVELAFRFCSKPVIAVTGSNGKTTTVTLIRNVLAEAGFGVCLCGNVGEPFTDFVQDMSRIDYVVLEISSFQLETIEHFRPRIAVFLNFSQNHLDRHKDVDEYFDAKKRIFMNQGPGDYAVLNAQIDRISDLVPELRASVVLFNEDTAVNPNHQAVLKVAGVLGIGEEVCRKVFGEFKGVEHRMETVRTLDGVDYINDSKSTTAESGRWALQNIDRPIVMICGGRDKNIDFSVLNDLVRRKVKRMIAYGEARGKLKKTFEGVVAVDERERLPEAVEQARKSAGPGDCVLLSPMCASFDLFQNYEHRGRVFKEIVSSLR
ncbi:MAG: UDP-N-acetylmuramoyl-L-alanine--D-glutamate ligase [Candidatus Omnitrophota bacterium]|nr:UDP-N-acetylmuramoyl-L-alanine--D-glutamate ligase [Candidatus Omnitrophota bacterium]MDZ4242368.1 UDP-N-acetylmuramoyl-L-alanine--D-glutamate ligase [Candidatus Omnitrophota bacterium]